MDIDTVTDTLLVHIPAAHHHRNIAPEMRTVMIDEMIVTSIRQDAIEVAVFPPTPIPARDFASAATTIRETMAAAVYVLGQGQTSQTITDVTSMLVVAAVLPTADLLLMNGSEGMNPAGVQIGTIASLPNGRG